jgi:hypothetical protein
MNEFARLFFFCVRRGNGRRRGGGGVLLLLLIARCINANTNMLIFCFSPGFRKMK